MQIDEPNLAEHIYVSRAFSYAHHGIYVGNGKVIHFLTPMESGDPKTSKIIESDLKDFLGKDATWRAYRYAVFSATKQPSTYTTSEQPSTYTTWQSDDVNTVLRRALAALEEGFGQYNIVGNNCEDFALYCKTGQRCLASGQFVSTLDKIAAVRQASASGYRNPIVYAGCVLGWFTAKDFRDTVDTRYAGSFDAGSFLSASVDHPEAPSPDRDTVPRPSKKGPQIEAVKGSTLPGRKIGPLETSL